MAGYIGSKASVTQVDGYTRSEADAEFVNDPNDVITVSGSNVGIGTTSPESTPSTKLHIREDDSTDYRARAVVQASDQRLVLGSHWQAGVGQYSYVQATNSAETAAQTLSLNPDGGAVTMPYQPAFNARVNENTAYNTTGWNKITIGNLMNQRGSHYNTSTSRFTAPVSGWYHMSMSVVFNAGNDNDGAISLGINGGFSNNGIGVNQSKNGGSYNGKSASGSVYMTAGDYAEVYVFITAAMTTRDFVYAGYFSGHLIG